MSAQNMAEQKYCLTRNKFDPQAQTHKSARRKCKTLCLAWAMIVIVFLASPFAVRAQTSDNGAPSAQETPSAPFDSALPTPVATPLPSDTPAPTAPPTSTPPTSTPAVTATPTPTPTDDLAGAVMQISPLKVAPDERPLNNSGAFAWLATALVVVLVGAVVMAAARTRR